MTKRKVKEAATAPRFTWSAEQKAKLRDAMESIRGTNTRAVWVRVTDELASSNVPRFCRVSAAYLGRKSGDCVEVANVLVSLGKCDPATVEVRTYAPQVAPERMAKAKATLLAETPEARLAKAQAVLRAAMPPEPLTREQENFILFCSALRKMGAMQITQGNMHAVFAY